MGDAQNHDNPQHSLAQRQAGDENGDDMRSIGPYRRGELRAGWGAPFPFMQRFMDDMDRLFDDFRLGASTLTSRRARVGRALARSTWAPKVDVFDRDGQMVVHAELAGLRQEDVRVNVEQGALVISGERSHTHDHEKDGVYQCERSYGRFQRAIALPDSVNPETIRASFDNGVLEVTMP